MKKNKAVELKLGHCYNSEELGLWFGLAGKTIRNSKQTYLEKLSRYAVYQEVGSKIQILQIFHPIYMGKKVKTIVAKTFDLYWPEDTLLSGAEVARRIISDYNLPLEAQVVAKEVNELRKSYYGDATKGTQGTRGYSERRWGKKKLNGDLVLLTDEETLKLTQIRTRTLGVKSQSDMETLCHLIEEGCSEEEAWAEIGREKGQEFIRQVRQTFEGVVVRGTKNWSSL